MRRLLALVSSIIFVDAMLFTALTPLIPAYAEEFDLSKLGAGVLVGSFGAGAILGGIPGGLAAARFGAKRAVVAGLLLLGVASVLFALAQDVETLSAARFVQGFSSTTTWAGALAWVSVRSAREQRGAVIGTAFGAAVFGAVIGPVFGGLAELVGIRVSFLTVGAVAFLFAALASIPPSSRPEPLATGGVSRAFRDPRFLGGLWLNALPAFLFGILFVLAPLALDAAGWSTLAIASVFFVTLSIEALINPVLGRVSDRSGPRRPVRAALAVSSVVTIGLASSPSPEVLAGLAVAAGASFGSCYTPGMTLTSHRADAAGLAQGLAFGFMNSAWAVGALVGPTLGGALADAFSDTVPYLVGAACCLLTLGSTFSLTARRARPRAA